MNFIMKNTLPIRLNKNFKRMYYKGKTCANQYLAVYYLKNKLNSNRLGITVSKKIGKAVVRNKVKRLIKENYRLKENLLVTGFDLVIVSRVRANSANFRMISQAMDGLFDKINLFKR